MIKAKRKREAAKILTLAFSDLSYKRLEQLEKVVAAESKLGVILQALRLLEFMAKKATDGYVFQIVDPQGHSEQIEILEFQNV